MPTYKLSPLTFSGENEDAIVSAIAGNHESSEPVVTLEHIFGIISAGTGDGSTFAESGASGPTVQIKAHATGLFSNSGFSTLAAILGTNGGTGVTETSAESTLSQLQDMADYLTTGFWEDVGESPQKFNLGTSGFSPNNGELLYNVSGYAGDPDGLTDPRAALVREAFKVYGEVLGITFTETTSTGDQVDIFFGDNNSGAYSGSVFDPVSGFIDYSYVNIALSWAGGTSGYNDYTLQTIFHEIGHTLGLGHPGPYDGSAAFGVDNIFDNDSWQATMMSYFSQAENTNISASELFLQGPMAVDWIALDNLYGPQGYGVDQAFLGDTVYGFNTNITFDISDIWANFAGYADITASTIIDGGGIDTLDFSGYSTTQVINLAVTSGTDTAPSLSDIGGATGNLALAVGTVIENAIGGSGSDSIFGNFTDNILTGNGGSDLLFGYGGNDTISGGDAADELNGGSGDDDLSGDGGNDRLVDSFGTNTLSGGAGNDIVSAFSGSSVLYGGSEDDILIGGIGADGLYGDAGSDVLIGDVSTTYFGNDVLRGGTGDDMLSGGGGADQFLFNPADGTDTIGTLAVDYATPSNSSAIAADFQSGLDIIVLAGFGYATPEEAFAHVTDGSGTATFSDQGTTIIFDGLSVADLSADDFVVVSGAEDIILA